MEDEDIKKSLSKSVTLVKDLDEQFQIPAFKILFEYFLLTSVEASDISKDSLNTPRKAVSRRLTLAEFIIQTNAKSYSNQVLVTAYYLLNNEIETFTVSMLIEEFTKARLKKPANMADIVNQLVKKGFIQEKGKIDKNKAYQLTITGQQNVDEFLKAS